MKKKLQIVLLFLWSVPALQPVVAQQQLVNTQYMYNRFLINPAFAGDHGTTSFTGIHRSQWSGLEESPTAQVFSVHAPIEGKRIALGGYLFRESLSVTEHLGAQLAYAYRIPLQAGVLSLGLQGGLINTRKDFSNLLLRHPDDPEFPSEVVSTLMPSFGAGVMYQSNNFFISVSIPQVGVYNRNDGGQEVVDIQEMRHYFFNMGFSANLNPDVRFEPSVMVRVTDGLPIEVDVNATMVVSETFWVGFSYRHNTSLNFISQIQLTDQIRVGYAYDLETNNLRRVATGNHEIMLNYRLQLFSGEKEVSSSKSSKY